MRRNDGSGRVIGVDQGNPSWIPPSPSEETVLIFVMPAETGIQSAVNLFDIKDLDFRFRGNDGIFLITTQSRGGESKVYFF
jgi:hypothetical protein